MRSVSPVLKSLHLVGERAALRPIRASDAADAYAWLHEQDDVLRWVPWSGPESPDELERHYSEWRRSRADGWDYTFAIVNSSEQFCGALTLRFGGHAGSGDVGYWIAPEHQAQGLASEALELVCWLAFEHLETMLLVAQTDVRHAASKRVLEKAGFAVDLETTVTHSTGPRQEAHLSLSRRAWRRRTERPVPTVVDVELEPAISG